MRARRISCVALLRFRAPTLLPVTEVDLLLQLAGVLATAQQHDESTSVYGRAIAVAVADRVSQPELDVARYLRAEHLLSMKRHHDVIKAAEEITSESMLHAPARALEAAALAELGRPGAVETAIVAASAARTDEQRERIIALFQKCKPLSDALTRSLFEAVRAGNVEDTIRALAGGAYMGGQGILRSAQMRRHRSSPRRVAAITRSWLCCFRGELR